MIITYKDMSPQIDSDAFIASSSDIIGRVSIEKNANIWYGAVIRGDVNQVFIGENTNVQDNVTIHVADRFACNIGKDVTIGHGAIVHACTVEDNVLIGMGAIILDGAHIEKNVLIGAGALVPPGMRIPEGSLVLGSPAKVKRTLTEDEITSIKHSSQKYVELSKEFINNGR